MKFFFWILIFVYTSLCYREQLYNPKVQDLSEHLNELQPDIDEHDEENMPLSARFYTDGKIRKNIKILHGSKIASERIEAAKYLYFRTSVTEVSQVLISTLPLFSNKDLQVVTDSGQKLQANLKLLEPRLHRARAIGNTSNQINKANQP